jgi:NADPH:quinone reductase-like Zn-dependent oxidoreductase
MKAAVFGEYGGVEVLRVEEVATPAPREGEVLLRVRAAALNHLDLWVRQGLPIEITMPHIGGSDIAGEVVEVGSGVAGVEVGARVVVDPSLGCGRCEWCRRGEVPLCVEYRIIGEHTQGGFAEYAVVPAANLYPIPESYSFEEAAAAPLVFLTAWRGLISRGRLRAGEDVLVTGASGGVATAAIQIAKLAGARVFAVTTTENLERVRELGADVVYDRTAVDFSRELWKDTGKRGVDLTLDSVGSATWTQNLRALARGGRLVVYGATTGPVGETDLRVLFWKQAEIIGTTMSNRREFDEVMKLVFRGALRPVVDVVWPLERIREAHERMEAGEQFGKIVLVP